MGGEFCVQAKPLTVLELFCWNIIVTVLSKIYKCSCTSETVFCIPVKVFNYEQSGDCSKAFGILAGGVSAGIVLSAWDHRSPYNELTVLSKILGCIRKSSGELNKQV